ncbi:beta-N-acetylglucosaminidase domain-containing protein [Flexivirga alba]|uniref:Beta-N-acetylglucosaminidase domain-containing protein n=1 Tax=Flexivirga alba TaxID=702742 RepID=A0ABW2ACJ5_9MICO
MRSTRAGAGKTVAIGGVDGAGQFYGVQTLRQLFGGSTSAPTIASVSVSDFPSMPLRGTIEGFYGPPWSHQARLDHLDFLGQVKANTYVYTPKADPYLRDKWRTPYPADKLSDLKSLVSEATDNHVHFTYAVSPGLSICYSSTSDRNALEAKFQSMYDLGVRSFSIPLDDISYTKWNCAADQTTYGAPGRESAAKAQVSLLNDIQRNWIDKHAGAQPLQMVPTEYGDLTDTAYKQTMRATLDPDVVVMWTGTDVVPPSVTNAQADAVSKLFGRKVFLWDNYPVNDFGNTRGRLLLAPYDKREAGLSNHLTGIVANPMNEAYASDVAVFGTADFSWNDKAYDATTDWKQAMSYLAGGDPTATAALQVFGDLEHMAPTFGATPWQPQAPALAERVKAFWTALDGGHPADAIAALRTYAVQIQDAPVTIRGGAVSAGFVNDADPWLTATGLWGQAMVAQLDALSARLDGDVSKANTLTAQSKSLQKQAAAVMVPEGRNNWGSVPVKVGDGVLDTFLTAAGDLVDHPVTVQVPAKALLATDGTTKVPVEVTNRVAGDATGVKVTVSAPSGVTVTPATVDIGSLAAGQTAKETVTLGATGSTPTAREVSLTTKVDWTGSGGVESATTTDDLQSSCALTPTRPVAATADSEESGAEQDPVTNAIDGDPATFWHTDWSVAPVPSTPHWIATDLGASRSVCGVRYLPRQDGNPNGRIGKYEVYTSTDGKSWGDPVASGTFANTASEKWIPFSEKAARYVKLVAVTEVSGNPWTSAAEVSVDAR